MALVARSPAMLRASQPRIAARKRVSARTAAQPMAATVAVEQATYTSVHSLTGDSYHDFIASHDLVLVDYYTEWCGPCKIIAPHLEQMALELPGIKFAKLNCTTEASAKKIAMAQGIKALPTFHIFHNSERVGVFVGGKPNQLRKFIEEHISKHSS